MNARKPPPTVREMCEGIHADSPVEHILVCPICGQMFDCRDQAQVKHHSQPEHEAKLR